MPTTGTHPEPTPDAPAPPEDRGGGDGTGAVPRAGRSVAIDVGIGLGWGSPAEVALRVGVARLDEVVVRTESLTIGDQALHPEVTADGSSLELLRTTGEQSWIAYHAEVELGPRPAPAALPLVDRLELTAPSRYCPSDTTAGFAAATFGTIPPAEAIDAVTGWVRSHTDYRIGASQVTTTAVETLASAAGVCRDFAHLTICLLRGLGVPARYVAVYAPGLEPPDFHALVEAHDGERWRLVDPTGLSDPSVAVRIGSGRDGADVPFLAVLSGQAPVTDVVVDVRLDPSPG